MNGCVGYQARAHGLNMHTPTDGGWGWWSQQSHPPDGEKDSSCLSCAHSACLHHVSIGNWILSRLFLTLKHLCIHVIGSLYIMLLFYIGPVHVLGDKLAALYCYNPAAKGPSSQDWTWHPYNSKADELAFFPWWYILLCSIIMEYLWIDIIIFIIILWVVCHLFYIYI